MTRTASAIVVVMAAASLTPRAVSAQTPPAGPGRIQASIGGLWIGMLPLGSTDANETASSGTGLKLFGASSDLAAAAGVNVRVAVRVTRTIAVEAEASYAKPQLRVTLANDFESAPPVTAIEIAQQFLIGGNLVWYLPLATKPSRLAPFALAGAGHLRQLHEGATLVETGHYFQAGGGVSYLLASRPDRRLTGIGIRADLRAVVRVNGVAFDAKGHAAPALGAAVFVNF